MRELFLDDVPKLVALLLLPLYSGFLGSSAGGFLMYGIAAICAMTVGERLGSGHGSWQAYDLATSLGFWFGQCLIFGVPAYGLGRLVSSLPWS